MYTPWQHRRGGLTDEGSYSKQRVAPKPSSRHAILSFHNERVPSRSVSRRNFNTLVYLTNVRPLPPPLAPFPLFLFPRIFAPVSFSSSSSSSSSASSATSFFFRFLSFLIRISRLFVRRFFVLCPYVFLFPLSFFRFSRYTKRRTRSPVAKSPFCISPPRKRGPGRHVAAVRLESGIYCQLNGPVPRPTYPERSF